MRAATLPNNLSDANCDGMCFSAYCDSSRLRCQMEVLEPLRPTQGGLPAASNQIRASARKPGEGCHAVAAKPRRRTVGCGSRRICTEFHLCANLDRAPTSRDHMFCFEQLNVAGLWLTMTARLARAALGQAPKRYFVLSLIEETTSEKPTQCVELQHVATSWPHRRLCVHRSWRWMRRRKVDRPRSAIVDSR